MTCEVEHGVAVITLNRPERLNAIGPEMGEVFDRLMVRAGTDDAVRAIVLTGAGRGFCAGADVARLDDLVETRGKSHGRPPPGAPHPVFDVLVDAPPTSRTRYVIPSALPKPVIAAVNGACAGVGLSLAVTSDLRFASAEAFFTASFVRRGLTAEHALASTLPALVGQGAAADMLLSGRRVTAAEALALGLVNAVLAPDALLPHAIGYARDLAQNSSPRSMRIIKRQLWEARDQSLSQALLSAHEHLIASLASDDFQEGVAHFKERRPARFTGR